MDEDSIVALNSVKGEYVRPPTLDFLKEKKQMIIKNLKS